MAVRGRALNVPQPERAAVPTTAPRGHMAPGRWFLGRQRAVHDDASSRMPLDDCLEEG